MVGLVADVDIESEKLRWMGALRLDVYVCDFSISRDNLIVHYSRLLISTSCANYHFNNNRPNIVSCSFVHLI